MHKRSRIKIHKTLPSTEDSKIEKGKKEMKNERKKVSISPTFYEQLFCTKVLNTAFLCLQLGFVIFWPKKISAKAARKMLVKLTQGRNKRYV